MVFQQEALNAVQGLISLIDKEAHLARKRNKNVRVDSDVGSSAHSQCNSSFDFLESQKNSNYREDTLELVLEATLVARELLCCWNSGIHHAAVQSISWRCRNLLKHMRDISSAHPPLIEGCVLFSEKNTKWRLRNVTLTTNQLKLESTTKKLKSPTIINLDQKIDIENPEYKGTIHVSIGGNPYAIRPFSRIGHITWMEALLTRTINEEVVSYVDSMTLLEKLQLYKTLGGRAFLFERCTPGQLETVRKSHRERRRAYRKASHERGRSTLILGNGTTLAKMDLWTATTPPSTTPKHNSRSPSIRRSRSADVFGDRKEMSFGLEKSISTPSPGDGASTGLSSGKSNSTPYNDDSPEHVTSVPTLASPTRRTEIKKPRPKQRVKVRLSSVLNDRRENENSSAGHAHRPGDRRDTASSRHRPSNSIFSVSGVGSMSISSQAALNITNSSGIEMRNGMILSKINDANNKSMSMSRCGGSLYNSYVVFKQYDTSATETGEITVRRVFGLSKCVSVKGKGDVEIFCGSVKRLWLHGDFDALHEPASQALEIQPQQIIYSHTNMARLEFEIRYRSTTSTVSASGSAMHVSDSKGGLDSGSRSTALGHIFPQKDQINSTISDLSHMKDNEEILKLAFYNIEDFQEFHSMYNWFEHVEISPYYHERLLSRVRMLQTKVLGFDSARMDSIGSQATIVTSGTDNKSRVGSKAVSPQSRGDIKVPSILSDGNTENKDVPAGLSFGKSMMYTPSAFLPTTMADLFDVLHREAERANQSLKNTSLASAHILVLHAASERLRLTGEAAECARLRLLLQLLLRGTVEPRALDLEGKEPVLSRNGSRRSVDLQWKHLPEDHRCLCSKGRCLLLVYRLLDRLREPLFSSRLYGDGVGERSLETRLWTLKLAWAISRKLPRAKKLCKTPISIPQSSQSTLANGIHSLPPATLHAIQPALPFAAIVDKISTAPGGISAEMIKVLFEILVMGRRISLAEASADIGQFHPHVANPELVPVFLSSLAMVAPEKQIKYLGKLLMLLHNHQNRQAMFTTKIGWQNWVLPLLLQAKHTVLDQDREERKNVQVCSRNHSPASSAARNKGASQRPHRTSTEDSSHGTSPVSNLNRRRMRMGFTSQVEEIVKLVVSLLAKLHAHDLVGPSPDDLSTPVGSPKSPVMGGKSRRRGFSTLAVSTLKLPQRKHRHQSRASFGGGLSAFVSKSSSKDSKKLKAWMKANMGELQVFQTIRLLRTFLPWDNTGRSLGCMILVASALSIKSIDAVVSKQRTEMEVVAASHSSWGWGSKDLPPVPAEKHMLYFLVLVGTFIFNMPLQSSTGGDPRFQLHKYQLDEQGRATDIGLIDSAIEAARALKLNNNSTGEKTSSTRKNIGKLLKLLRNIRKELKALPSGEAVSKLKLLKQTWMLESVVVEQMSAIKAKRRNKSRSRSRNSGQQRGSWFRRALSVDKKTTSSKKTLPRTPRIDGFDSGVGKDSSTSASSFGKQFSDKGVGLGYFVSSTSDRGLSYHGVELANAFVRGRRNSYTEHSRKSPSVTTGSERSRGHSPHRNSVNDRKIGRKVEVRSSKVALLSGSLHDVVLDIIAHVGRRSRGSSRPRSGSVPSTRESMVACVDSSTFVGQEAIDHLVRSGAVRSRYEAQQIGTRMIELGLIEHVTGRYTTLEDAYAIYRALPLALGADIQSSTGSMKSRKKGSQQSEGNDSMSSGDVDHGNTKIL